MASLTRWTWIWASSVIVKDREAWRAAVHRASKSQTWLSTWTTTWIISEEIKILKVRKEESEVGEILYFPLVHYLFWLACPCMNAFPPPPPWNLNKWMNKIHWAALYAKHHPRQLGDKVWSYFIYFPSQGSVGPMFPSPLWSSTSIPILLRTGPPHTIQLIARKAERMEPEPSWPCQRGLSDSLHHWHRWLGWSESRKSCDDAWSLSARCVVKQCCSWVPEVATSQPYGCEPEAGCVLEKLLL